MSKERKEGKKERKILHNIHRIIELQIFGLNMEHGTAVLPPDVTGVVLSLWRVSVRDDRVPFLPLPFLLLLLRRVLLICSTFGVFFCPFSSSSSCWSSSSSSSKEVYFFFTLLLLLRSCYCGSKFHKKGFHFTMLRNENIAIIANAVTFNCEVTI